MSSFMSCDGLRNVVSSEQYHIRFSFLHYATGCNYSKTRIRENYKRMLMTF